MLQVRAGKRSPQAALRIAIDMAEDESFPLSREDAVRQVADYLVDPPTVTVAADRPDRPPLATGLPASPGRASGEIATDPESAVSAAEAGRTTILVRSETSPNDVHGMARAAGILTARGGLASHAAVVARGWGIPAVVGAADVVVDSNGIAVGDRRLRAGEVITIDGGTGEVFEGTLGGTTQVAPEAATLMDWARELGVPIEDAHSADRSASGEAPVTAAGCLRALAIKGLATADGLSDALGSNVQVVQPVVDELAAAGDAVASAGAFRLTEAGRARAAQVVATERDAWGVGAATAALDAFLEIDQDVKSIVTAWQVRDRDAQVINDHSDAEYDASVLDRLAKLHDEARRWLTANEPGYPRLARYRTRLESALARAREGDGRYVASPRVDSYHGVWFELHEDLIQLAGRTREEEAAAGRA
jgi:pyruvate, orthophosphate dikinase